MKLFRTIAEWMEGQPTAAQRREAYEGFLRADHADNGCPYADGIFVHDGTGIVKVPAKCPVSCDAYLASRSPANSWDMINKQMPAESHDCQ